MDFGIPKEVRDLEMRVGLTPAGVVSLIKRGHRVYLERNAGADAGFRDEHYEQAGAQIVYTADEAYGRADVVLKVARPTAAEHALFRHNQVIFSFFHLTVASSDLVTALKENAVTAIAYEVMEEPDGRLPVLLPMSEVAGRLAPVFAGQLLTSAAGGRGILLSGLPGVARAIAVIVGAGSLGQSSGRSSASAPSDRAGQQREPAARGGRDVPRHGFYHDGHRYNLERAVGFADVLVGAVLRGASAPRCWSHEMVAKCAPARWRWTFRSIKAAVSRPAGR
ncbi:MAG: hypothetical protein R2838_26325 [Caldilineaceae bacterium]